MDDTRPCSVGWESIILSDLAAAKAAAVAAATVSVASATWTATGAGKSNDSSALLARDCEEDTLDMWEATELEETWLGRIPLQTAAAVELVAAS